MMKNEDDMKTTGEKFRAVANECCDNIVWEDDIPSEHPEGKLPILDLMRTGFCFMNILKSQ